jgi:hypothetical protein
MNMKKILIIAFLFFFITELKAQINLTAGDIAFVRLNEDVTDGFSFMALANIPGSTKIYFTDSSWGNGVWGTDEGHFLYTAPAAGLLKGAVVHCDETGTDVFTVTGAGGTMAAAMGSFNMAGGDQVIAYQSNTGVKPASPTFIAAINTDDGGSVQQFPATTPATILANDATGWVTGANWDASGKGSQGSVLPTGLVAGTTAIGMFPQTGAWQNLEQDNMRYDCSKGTSGTKAQLLALINNRANWLFNDATPYPAASVCAPLPVKLLAYQAKIAANQIVLTWQTASEQNNKGFEIYRSGDDRKFVKMAEIVGNKTTMVAQNYAFYDKQPLQGNNYYRLVQIDLNGEEAELGERVVNFGLSNLNLKLSPNPTTAEVQVFHAAGKFSQLQVVDVQGHVKQKITIKANTTTTNVNIAGYPKGIYWIRLNGKGEQQSGKLIKN